MTRCVVVLGGSFDPVHNGHVELATHFANLLLPDELRVIPAAHPWQKDIALTPAHHRIEMVRRAFDANNLPITIDLQEIRRAGATYTIDTLRQLRAELGQEASIVFLLGADQLQRLNSWKDWLQLFDLAHLCAAARPGYPVDTASIPEPVAIEFTRRAGSIDQIRTTPSGLACLSHELSVDVSATNIRNLLRHGEKPQAMLPQVVLDYIEQFHLYRD